MQEVATNTDETLLRNLFAQTFNCLPSNISPLSAHASKRSMYRLTQAENKLSVIAVVNDNLEENDSFVAFANTFSKAQLPAPFVSAYQRDAGIYLVQDLGDETLYDKICAYSPSGRYSPAVFSDYKKITQLLPNFQTKAAKLINASDCFEGAFFDVTAAVEDIDAFYEFFLSLALPECNWAPIREELITFSEAICHLEEFEFMHRDFQSRNIMLVDGDPIFIDFQSGRFGPPQYDLASLLYQAQAQIPNSVREQLLSHYLDARKSFGPLNREQFIKRFYEIAILRQIQVLSAYGRLGLKEGKSYFLGSIPLALNNLQYIHDTQGFNTRLPLFTQLITQLQQKFCHQE